MYFNIKNLFILIMIISFTGCQDSTIGRNIDFSAILDNPDDIVGDEDGGEETLPVRPDNALRISSFCGCRGTEPIFIGEGCQATCQANSTTQNELLDILYMDITVDPDISLNSAFGNFEGWCNNEVPGNDEQAQGICEIQVESTETGNSFSLNTSFVANGNRAQVDITELANEENFRISIVERLSGAGSANVVQFKKTIPVDNPFASLGPVSISPVNQYSCLIFPTIIPLDNGQFSTIGAGRAYFYYTDLFLYSPLPIGTQTGVCFDFQLENVSLDQDRQEYPRLETIPGAFSLWNPNDVRFRRNWSWRPGEQQTDGKRDIIDLLELEVYRQTLNLSVDLTDLFRPLNGFQTPTTALGLDENAGGVNQVEASEREFGFYLSPLSRDSITTYCPDNDDYNATVNVNPVDIALSRIIGVETEALYSAVIAETPTTTDSSGNVVNLPITQIYISRSQLDAISFYIDEGNGGILAEPDENDYNNRTIFFHWPATTSTLPGARFVRTQDQEVYRVERPPREGDTGVIPQDGRIGCVPRSL